MPIHYTNYPRGHAQPLFAHLPPRGDFRARFRLSPAAPQPGEGIRRALCGGTRAAHDLAGHPERGEERFLLERLPVGGCLLLIDAVAEPASTFWQAVSPALKAAQWCITRYRYLPAISPASGRGWRIRG
ncbi:DUF1990 family protein [Corynebacterium sp.]|uniref:DUF1990 family protein n=1 Tax=Corynebacterium sp. TaxID=1720 RepID=UPI0026DD5B74|nr:DUF1990 family protein [Corynebacterium sp.]MDO5031091.1 DUF1990 family protein [Corynebacterium sp.]